MSIAGREFMTGMTAAGAAGLVGLRPASAAAEPPPEATTIRLYHQPIACLAPLLVAATPTYSDAPPPTWTRS